MLVHGERTMNGKRLLIAAVFAVFATIVAPRVWAAGTISNQANITVKWNTVAVGSMTLNSNYSATGAQQLTAPAIVQTQNSGAGTCSTNGAGSEAAATVNFGNVTADGAKYTDCQYRNAAVATVTTSDPNGYSVTTQNVSGALPASYALCALGNGAANTPGATAFANNGAVFQDNTGAATAVTSTTCPTVTNGWNVGSTTASTLLSPTSATTGTNLGADYVLVIGPNAAIQAGGYTFNVQYTLTLN
jgi:hypothetical protein